MRAHEHDYIPAAGHDRFLRFYDPLTWLMGAGRVRGRLLDAADVKDGERVLDLGCGTGAVSLLLAQRRKGARIVGLDPDPKALALAARKSEAAGASIAPIEWREGYAGRAPFSPASFDRVVSSLMIHHLTSEQKRETFRDVKRLLRPGGTFHVLDFGPPRNLFERALTAVMHHDDRVGDNLQGRLPEWLREAGFSDVREIESHRTLFGRLSLYGARA